jgi:hypothetical protein
LSVANVDLVRRRRDSGLSVAGILITVITAFYFSAVEIAVVFWLLALAAMADAICTFGRMAQWHGRRRWIGVTSFVVIGLAVSSPGSMPSIVASMPLRRRVCCVQSMMAETIQTNRRYSRSVRGQVGLSSLEKAQLEQGRIKLWFVAMAIALSCQPQ